MSFLKELERRNIPLVYEIEAWLPLEGVFTLFPLVSAERNLRCLIFSKESIYKPFPISYLKFKEKEKEKSFGSKAHSCSFLPLSAVALSESGEISFAGVLTTHSRLRHSTAGLSSSSCAEFSPPPLALQELVLFGEGMTFMYMFSH